ncbi:SAM-dependent methyltransferase [Catenuloplanes atrovinosus]|uniref:S-adenosyl methyltransferase n=1 Tax=Catenuloplanes atrovinosus TaxID=137266 RepID=A0AAE3YK30_9ACTN|nr:SAM-dependent methyltransferase [Catenuloplanes atrovinosus]MDR7274357.1 hypothetical protein [Catenuloplanes atrovinosus]
MRELPDRVPDGVDFSVPNAARIYDHALGGYHNFAIDREFWRTAEELVPGARGIAHAHRAFLGRAVRELAALGIRQFLDLGSGLPTLGNVHEAARDADPGARVIYVDNDAATVVQGRALLEREPRVRVIEGDLRRPEDVLYHPEVLDLLDFAEPVAVLLVDVLHLVPDADRPAEIVARLGEACVSGSHVVLSHQAPDPEHAGLPYPMTVFPRTAGELSAILGDFDIVDPGVVPATDWRPDPLAAETSRPSALAAVARKR